MNQNKPILYLMLLPIALLAEDSDVQPQINEGIKKNLESGALLIVDPCENKRQGVKLFAGKTSVSIDVNSGKIDNLTLMLRSKESIIFFTDYNIDGEYDLKAIYSTTVNGAVDEDSERELIRLGGQWIGATKGVSKNQMVVNGIPYIFSSVEKTWVAYKSEIP